MTSYNAINGTPSPANTYTANELAQRTYGFGGYVTSDCGAVGDIYSNGAHNWAPPGWSTGTSGGTTTWTNNTTGAQVPGAAGGQAYALRAGTDVNCTGGEATLPNVQAAINAGILSEGVIDTDLVHLFTVRMETGEFDPPSSVPYTKISKDVIQSPAHQALARQIADNSIVLLKNDNVTGSDHPLLPVDAAKLKNVVIVGNLANTVTLGGYSGDPSLQVNAVQGIEAAVRATNPDAVVTFDACGTSTTSTNAASCSAATTAAMKTADLVIAFVGTDLNIASEGRDRGNIAMPGNYSSLLSQVTASGNPNTALVIQSNGPVDISSVQSSFPAIVFSGYNGESQGSALADVLTGAQNPSGHLDFTWFKNDSQLPPMENYGLDPSETDGLGRTYMYFTGTPTFPFGYGLSYSRFAYRNIQVSPKSTTPSGDVTVNFSVTNTGTTAGATVAQVYAAPQFSVPGVELPKRELVAFQKTQVLAPGHSQHISLTVAASSLSRWDENSLKQVVDAGTYQFQVATDADDIAGSGTVQIAGTITPQVQYVTVQPGRTTFKPGDTVDLAAKNPWIADDTNPAMEQPHATADHIVEAVNNDQSFVDLKNATVSYASSNPAVATVSSTGTVTTIAHGAAQISVTVNGVTGTMPVVVKQPFSLSAPSVVQPGSSFTATTTLPNTSSQALSKVSMALTGPTDWTVAATTPATFASVAAGQAATTTWKVTVPSTAKSAAMNSTPLRASPTRTANRPLPTPHKSPFRTTRLPPPSTTLESVTTPIRVRAIWTAAATVLRTGARRGQPGRDPRSHNQP
jgi:beta-glucosidase